jgi:hypothetical protein
MRAISKSYNCTAFAKETAIFSIPHKCAMLMVMRQAIQGMGSLIVCNHTTIKRAHRRIYEVASLAQPESTGEYMRSPFRLCYLARP